MPIHAAQAQQRIARLAAALPVHRAFHWLHLHQPQVRQWLLDLLPIAAPTFAEGPRAAWFLERFTALGLSNVHLDAVGNALAELPAAPPAQRPPDEDRLGESSSSEACISQAPTARPVILLSAHLDTVFPAGTPTTPLEDGARILAPGSCDNGAGLSALLALAAALRFASIAPPTTILFAANVGEEGEGDLRGMRHLFLTGPFAGRIRAAIALEGAGTEPVVTRALGSRRFRLTVTGPGGHSWTDAGAPNPILLLARALTAAAAIPLPRHPRTTLNVGHIAGGTSINSIPESAAATLDLRSTDPAQLAASEADLRRVLADSLVEPNHPHNGPLATSRSPQAIQRNLPDFAVLEVIGDRPAASLPENSPLLHTLRAVDRHLGLRTEPRTGSTDANLPLSLHIPAIAMGCGGAGGGIHTLAEWYDPSARELALRRIVLTLLDLAARDPTCTKLL